MAETHSFLIETLSARLVSTLESGNTAPVRVLLSEPDLLLHQALAAFDSARSWEEGRAARDRILALGPEVLPSVLAELSIPQPPDRYDLLLALLVKWESPDGVIALATSEGSGEILRSALAEGLGRFVDGAYAGDSVTIGRIAGCLARLVRDPDVGVRITAVEAVGISGLALTSDLRDALRLVAASDRSPNVRKEARAIIGELES